MTPSRIDSVPAGPGLAPRGRPTLFRGSKGGVCGSSRSDGGGAEGAGTTAPPLISVENSVAREVEKECRWSYGARFLRGAPSWRWEGMPAQHPAPEGEEDWILSCPSSYWKNEGEVGARAGDPGLFELMKLPGLTTLCYERWVVRREVFVGWEAPGPTTQVLWRWSYPRTDSEGTKDTWEVSARQGAKNKKGRPVAWVSRVIYERCTGREESHDGNVRSWGNKFDSAVMLG